MKINRWLPLIVGGVVALVVAFPLFKGAGDGFDFDRLGSVPVLHHGRVKPLDTVARTAMLALRGKQVLRVEDRSIYPMEWLAEVVVHPEKADDYPLVVIENSEILGILGKQTESKPVLSFKELMPYLAKIEEEASLAEQVESNERSRYQRDIVTLKSKLVSYTQLKNTFRPEGVAHFDVYVDRYVLQVPDARGELNGHLNPDAMPPATVAALNEIMLYFKQFHYISRASLFRACPPLNGTGDWMTLGDGFLVMLKQPEPHLSATKFTQAFAAYERGQPGQFNRVLDEYHGVLDREFSSGISKVKTEFLFNKAQIFYTLMVVYLVAVVFTFFAWLLEKEWVLRVAYWLVVWGFAYHTLAILVRMWIEGRPPVTNLYTSAVFVGWVAIALGIVLERIYKNGLGSIVSGMIGFMTLIVAHHLSLDGDTMQMMQAVLDSNFWLSTHVVTICIGYGATFLAGFLGIIYVFRGILSKNFDADTRANLIRMIYTIVCFALLFSFIGTVLGGIWADQSWGRFWGWDPKENGALMIVLWNAAILHCRWGGMIRARGMVAMVLFGNIVTSFSWFGVNMLGVGLHSYGFMDQAFLGLMVFVFSQLVVIWLAFLPTRYWRSLK